MKYNSLIINSLISLLILAPGIAHSSDKTKLMIPTSKSGQQTMQLSASSESDAKVAVAVEAAVNSILVADQLKSKPFDGQSEHKDEDGILPMHFKFPTNWGKRDN